MLLDRMPKRLILGNWPTPLQELPRLTQRIGGPRIYIKRDDETGVATGGNKLRELEFIFADAIDQNADVVITCGKQDSNHARITAAVAKKLGLDIVLVLNGAHAPEIPKGNMLLNMLMDVKLDFLPSQEWDKADERMESIAAQLRRQGRRPYIIPKGAACALGSLGYVLAVEEIKNQAENLHINVKWIILSSGTGGTQAGLVAGCHLLWPGVKVIGYSVGADPVRLQERVLNHANGAVSRLGIDTRIPREEVVARGDFIGLPHGEVTTEIRQAIQDFAGLEGIFLDPVYTAKGAAGLIEFAKNKAPQDGDILFLHTGGIPVLFTYDSVVL